MLLIGDLFNILLFVTMVGGLLTLLFCFLSKGLRLPLPLWFGICCITAYIVPINAWGTWLVPPEEHSWIAVYYILYRVWAVGILLLLLLRGLRSFLGYQAFRNCHPCEDKHILACCSKCAGLVGLRQTPSLFWGEVKHPACVLGVLRPAVILDQTVVEQLAEQELMAVLCHEMMHVKRKHLVFSSFLDYICIINWFNPLVWLMRQEFSVLCEQDCDRHTTAALADHMTLEDYARTLLQLLALSSSDGGKQTHGMGALGFTSASRRIRLLVTRHKKPLRIASFIMGILALTLTVLLSLHMSRSYFYPYLSRPGAVEYAAASTQYKLYHQKTGAVWKENLVKNGKF